MISKDTVWKDSEKFGEKNDCSVKAVALATGIKYAKVHYAFRKQGRKEGRGTHFYQQFAVLRELGFELKLVHVGHYNDPKVKNKFKAKTVSTLEKELPSRGIFLVYTRGHMLCARGGFWSTLAVTCFVLAAERYSTGHKVVVISFATSTAS
jgi:hypothetical protein